MSIKIVIHGVTGRMGQEIARIVVTDPDMVLAGCCDVPSHPAIGSDIGELLGMGKMGISVKASILDCIDDDSVIIDFTTPVATTALIDKIKNSQARIVIGTTGLSDDEILNVREKAKTRAILFSPNMSLGVNFLFYLAKVAAEKLGNDFDIEIIEMHHRNKKDSPSGTAKRLGEIVAEALGVSSEKAMKHGRNGIVGARTPKEIGMHAVRGGDIVGDHTVLFAGPAERIEIKHSAHSRTVFAQGAVKAAKWLHARPAGIYSMKDVLGF